MVPLSWLFGLKMLDFSSLAEYRNITSFSLVELA